MDIGFCFKSSHRYIDASPSLFMIFHVYIILFLMICQYEICIFRRIHKAFLNNSANQSKKAPGRNRPGAAGYSALAEGLAVGALVFGGIVLVRADLNSLKRAVVLAAAVVGALLDCAGDAVVGVTVLTASVLFHWNASSKNKNPMSTAVCSVVLIGCPV